jgi:DNA-binding transcriptional regulator YdaS (Cro superfamily)
MKGHPPTRDPILARAIDGAGGVAALAKALDISSQSISGWSRVPAERVLQVERLSGVSRHELRPDLYPAESEASAA